MDEQTFRRGVAPDGTPIRQYGADPAPAAGSAPISTSMPALHAARVAAAASTVEPASPAAPRTFVMPRGTPVVTGGGTVQTGKAAGNTGPLVIVIDPNRVAAVTLPQMRVALDLEITEVEAAVKHPPYPALKDGVPTQQHREHVEHLHRLIAVRELLDAIAAAQDVAALTGDAP